MCQNMMQSNQVKFIIIMHKKELRILDQQLNSNNLTRIPSSRPKSDKSLFRALSLSVYFNEDHEDEIMRILKLCLLCSCKVGAYNPFPTPQKKARFLGKFDRNQQIMDQYFQNPQLSGFVNDNLQLASLAFEKKVILFSVKDQYLHQTLITACKAKTKQPPIMIARRGNNQFYCVQKQTTRSVMMFIKQNIINQLINLEHRQKPQRHHKKSLSDCGEIMMFSHESEVTEKMYEYPESVHSQTDPHHMNMLNDDTYFYYHQYGNMNRTNINIPPNQRYTGRLKFFDQNGNYGFIVVDGFGCDLFVHYDDLQKTGIGKERFLNIRNSQQMRFQFTCLEYDGKYKKSKKAVDLVPLVNQY